MATPTTASKPPVQTSARSHGPFDARHKVPLDLKLSDGHDDELPEQTSATSHGPFAARHIVPAAASTAMTA